MGRDDGQLTHLQFLIVHAQYVNEGKMAHWPCNGH